MRHSVILAGGGGTRLWPASRRARPKQLLPLGAEPGQTLLQGTVRRLAPLESQVWVVTAAEQAAGIRADSPSVPADQIVVEPTARNTAAAIGLAAVTIAARDPEAVLALLPADQHVGDEAGFRDVAERAFARAERDDAIVTVGLRPTRPETGFGYLELGDAAPAPRGTDTRDGARHVARFVEKPDLVTAEGYVSSGRFLWNGGMFFFRAQRLLAELARHLPDTYAVLVEIQRALVAGGNDAAREAANRLYPSCPSISIDHGVMEKTEGILTLPGDFGWNDVGSWSALADYRAADANGNVVDGQALFHDARGNITVCDEGQLVALVGVQDLVVVQAGNAVLVIPKARAQDVKEIVRQLEAGQRKSYQ